MKKLITSLMLILAPVLAQASTAGLYFADNDPNASPDAINATTLNTVDLWTCTFGATGAAAGSYLAGTGAGTPAAAWALYSNSADALATNSLPGGSLAVGQTFSLGFSNRGIAAGDSVGINLTSGGNVEFSIFFTGGSSDGDYHYTDATSTNQTTNFGYEYSTTIPFSFTLTGAGTYSATFGTSVITGTLATSSIDGVQVNDNAEDSSTGGDVTFSNYTLLTAAPEPSPATLLLMGGLMTAGVIGFRRRLTAKP